MPTRTCQTNGQTDGRTLHDGVGRAYALHRAAKIVFTHTVTEERTKGRVENIMAV